MLYRLPRGTPGHLPTTAGPAYVATGRKRRRGEGRQRDEEAHPGSSRRGGGDHRCPHDPRLAQRRVRTEFFDALDLASEEGRLRRGHHRRHQVHEPLHRHLQLGVRDPGAQLRPVAPVRSEGPRGVARSRGDAHPERGRADVDVQDAAGRDVAGRPAGDLEGRPVDLQVRPAERHRDPDQLLPLHHGRTASAPPTTRRSSGRRRSRRAPPCIPPGSTSCPSTSGASSA